MISMMSPCGNTWTIFNFTSGGVGKDGNVVIDPTASIFTGSSDVSSTLSNTELDIFGTFNFQPNDGSAAPINVTNGASITVDAGGSLGLTDEGFSITFFTADGASGEQITIISTGRLTATVNNLDYEYLPILNAGSLTVQGGAVNNVRGILNVYGSIPAGDGSKYSVVTLAGDSNGGFTFLQGGSTLQTDQGYYQGSANGTNNALLQADTDTTGDVLGATNGNIVFDANSVVTFTTYPNTYGTLTLKGNVIFKGNSYYRPYVNGGQSGQCDLLSVIGNITFNNTTYVNPYTVGGITVTSGSWQVITCTGGYSGWFLNVSIGFPYWFSQGYTFGDIVYPAPPG